MTKTEGKTASAAVKDIVLSNPDGLREIVLAAARKRRDIAAGTSSPFGKRVGRVSEPGEGNAAIDEASMRPAGKMKRLLPLQ